MPGSSPKRARALYRRDTAEHRLKLFSEKLDPEAVRASREFHVRHWLSLAKDAIQRDHVTAYYQGLQQNVESAIAEHPEDRLPPDLQRAILADLAFMEGHLQAFREVIKLLDETLHRNSTK
jgi:hypothetical protein